MHWSPFLWRKHPGSGWVGSNYAHVSLTGETIVVWSIHEAALKAQVMVWLKHTKYHRSTRQLRRKSFKAPFALTFLLLHFNQLKMSLT